MTTRSAAGLRAEAMHRASPLLVAVALALSACDGGSADPAPQCFSPDTCPAPATPCLVATCVSGRCGTAPLLAGSSVDGGAAGDCRRRVCDGNGAVVLALDDVDVPADGNACTDDRCSAGVPSNPFTAEGTGCSQDGGAVCDGAGTCVQCLAAAHCGSATECATPTCTAGMCGTTWAASGTPLAGQVAQDCRLAVCDGLGGTTTVALDTDLPADDGNACTADRCFGGMPSHPPAAPGAPCSGPGGADVCNGGGVCVECVAASECPGTDGECSHPTCEGGACGIGFEPDGTPVTSQRTGDCTLNVCDGAGGVVAIAQPDDVLVDGDACTEDLCDLATPSNPPAPAGTACTAGGGTVCDGAGVCVACNVGGDCTSGVCAADHTCLAPTCDDGVRNGGETDVDCGGGTCDACAPPQACLVPEDCTTGICLTQLCRHPSCADGLRNGDESDVDCGGTCAADCARGRACVADGDCQTANCVDLVCAGPRVTQTIPADGGADVSPLTSITLFFARTITASTLTVQAADGPCSGSVQLSADDFATCAGMSLRASFSTSAVLLPSAPLAHGATYRIRTTAALASSTYGAFEAFETPAGFTTVGGGACDGVVVVSQVYAGGGLTGASYTHDFVELHNNGSLPVSVDGMSVQYASASGTTWTLTALSGTIPPGGYFLVQGASGGGAGAPLPAPDATGTLSLSQVGGKVALVSSTIPLSSVCATAGRLDLVGYGVSGTTPTSCFEGTGPAPAPADSGAALVRAGAGCADANGNSQDFVSRLVVPRNTSSAPFACGCIGSAVNGTGATVEMDLCSVHFPVAGLSAGAGQLAGPIYGRVYELDVTVHPGAPALQGEVGYGPQGTDPRYAAGWTFSPASWSVQAGNDDEFSGSFTAPGAGGYSYAYRFSPDGERWTYCDPNGAGSADGSPFEPNSLPTLSVTP